MGGNKQQLIMCAICGKNLGSTRDHVPPKGIFAKPVPANVITVPACHGCNGGNSHYDEAFRTYLCLHVGISNLDSSNLWERHVSRTLAHNNRLRNQVLRMSPIGLYTESGIFVGRGMAGRWDTVAFSKVMERTVRGLYYHHYGSVLGASVAVQLQWYRSLPEELKKDSERWYQNNIGGSRFIYRFLRADDEPSSSCWLFQFYGRFWVSAYTVLETAS